MDNEYFSQEFRLRLRETREAIGLSQSAVARLVGKRQNTFNEYESGKAKPPLIVVAQLAEVYHVTTDYLLGRTDHPHLPAKGGEEIVNNQKRTSVNEELLHLWSAVELIAAHLASLGIPLPELESVAPDLRASMARTAKRMGIAYIPNADIASESQEVWEAFLTYRMGMQETPPSGPPSGSPDPEKDDQP